MSLLVRHFGEPNRTVLEIADQVLVVPLIHFADPDDLLVINIYSVVNPVEVVDVTLAVTK